MPNRILKESICTSEELANLSPEAEVLFYRLIVKVDDFGLFHGNPKIIIGNCFPLSLPKQAKVESWLAELCRAGLVATYTADDGKKYLKLLSWDKHQQRRASKSKFPLPVAFDGICEHLPADDITCNQLPADDITCNQLPAIAPLNENENVNENEERERERRPNRASGVNGFDLFWTAYPKKVGKKDAKKAWEQLRPNETKTAAIIDSIERWKTSAQWTKDNGRFIPHPATFLRGERWNDEHDFAKPGEGGAPNPAGGTDPEQRERDALVAGLLRLQEKQREARARREEWERELAAREGRPWTPRE